MELGSYFLFLQEQITDIIIIFFLQTRNYTQKMHHAFSQERAQINSTEMTVCGTRFGFTFAAGQDHTHRGAGAGNKRMRGASAWVLGVTAVAMTCACALACAFTPPRAQLGALGRHSSPLSPAARSRCNVLKLRMSGTGDKEGPSVLRKESVRFANFFRELPRMDGKVVAMTGCTSGIGFVAARSVLQVCACCRCVHYRDFI